MTSTSARSLAVAPLIALIIFLGFYPKPVLDVINPAVTHTLHDVHQHRSGAAARTAVHGGEVSRPAARRATPLQTITAPVDLTTPRSRRC